MNQALNAWQSFGQPQQSAAKSNPYMAQPQQQTQQTGYRPQSNMSGMGYAQPKAATNYNTGAWGAGPQQNTAPQQPAQAAIPAQQTPTQQGWTRGTSVVPSVQQMANDNSKWGGAQAIGWANQLQDLKRKMDAAQARAGEKVRGGWGGHLWVDNAQGQKAYESYKNQYDAVQNKMKLFLEDQYKNVYGGDQSAMSGAMNNYWGDVGHKVMDGHWEAGPDGGKKWVQTNPYGYLSQQGQSDLWRQEYGDEYGYIQDMLKQMWGG
jgi:hypothetical protein